MSLPTPVSSLARPAVLALLSLGLSGCGDYLIRRDGLDRGAGDAVNTNIVTQLIDPWPRHAASTDPTTNGDRLARAMERYRTSQTSTSASTTPSQGGVAAVGSTTSGSGVVR